jgi:4-hydroxy-tetrahydrodipicolinate synthase
VLGSVLTAMVTPFTRGGPVDYEAFRDLARYLVANGSDGVVVCGTTGESPTLSDAEKIELWEAAVDLLRGRATVVAGTGTNATAHSIHLTKKATEIGVDGLLVVTPYYNKPPQRGIVEHFKAIAAVSDKPIVVYNIPSRVVINIEPETIEQLADIPTVGAVKQAYDDLDEARQIPELGLDLYAGDDNLIHPFLELGGLGGICVHTHVVGPQVKEMVRAFHSGDRARAKEIDEQLAPAYELLKVAGNPIAIKQALSLSGHDVGGLRLPMVEATEEETERVRSCLERLGVLVAA